jgi:hypothetical protein
VGHDGQNFVAAGIVNGFRINVYAGSVLQRREKEIRIR